MSEFLLPGLKATEPIGFLAGLGLLRVVAGRQTFGPVRLAWSDGPGWPAVLSTAVACDPARLVDDLLAHMRGRHQWPVFAGRPPDRAAVPIDGGDWDDVKVAPSLYRQLVQAVRAQVGPADREPADFLAALGSELVALPGKTIVKPSALHMTSGNQAFLETIRELARSLDPEEPPHPKAACQPAAAFREAIFAEREPGLPGWQAADGFSALGFDPTREAIYALTATAPTDTGPRSTRAAVWLAVEGLPLFPCLPIRGRLHTRGFDRRASHFHWLVWDGRMTIEAVRTIVSLKWHPSRDGVAAHLRGYGIRAVLRSDRVTIGQGYGQFRPAVRVE